MLHRLCALLLAVAAVAAGEETKSLRYDFREGMQMQFEVGTPGQMVTFRFEPFVMKMFPTGLEVTDARYFNGVFDLTKSKTFEQTGASTELTSGFDTLSVRSNFHSNEMQFPALKVEKMAVDVRQIQFGNKWGKLSFNYKTDGSAFVQRLLRQLGGEETVVFAIDRATDTELDGSVIFGDSKPRMCSGQWSVQDALDFGASRFAVPVKSIKVGRYFVAGPAPLTFAGKNIILNEEIYDQVIKELGGSKGKDHTVRLDCRTKTEIIVKVGMFEIRMGPRDYMFQKGAECRCTIDQSYGEANILPVKMLGQKCMRYDYDQLQVGFADYIGEDPAGGKHKKTE